MAVDHLAQEAGVLVVVVGWAILAAGGARPGRRADDADHQPQAVEVGLFDDRVVEEPLVARRVGLNQPPLHLHLDPGQPQLVADSLHGRRRVAHGGVAVDLNAVAELVGRPGAADFGFGRRLFGGYSLASFGGRGQRRRGQNLALDDGRR